MSRQVEAGFGAQDPGAGAGGGGQTGTTRNTNTGQPQLPAGSQFTRPLCVGTVYTFSDTGGQWPHLDQAPAPGWGGVPVVLLSHNAQCTTTAPHHTQ